MTRWHYATATDTGLVRDANQDAVLADDAIAIVADGMGGHAAGEVASAMSVETIYDGYLAAPTIDGVVAALDAANRGVLADAEANPSRFGMGTTAAVVALVDDASGHRVPVLFHVGDSRIYQLRDGALRQLTRDHSVAEEWVRMGRLTPEEALTHPRRHQLTRAIGVDQPLEIDVMTIHAQPGDRLVLCSDGLSNELSPDELAQLASDSDDLNAAALALVRAAIAAGGRDNISVVVLEFEEVAEASTPIEAVMTPLPPTPPEARPAATPVATTSRASRRFTWRSGLVAVIVLGLAAAFYGIMHWYAYANYYIAADGSQVAIYNGQPSGVLWFHPTLVAQTTYSLKAFRPADQQLISATISEPSVAAALTFVTYLHQQWELTQTSVTTTTSTTTTIKAHG